MHDAYRGLFLLRVSISPTRLLLKTLNPTIHILTSVAFYTYCNYCSHKPYDYTITLPKDPYQTETRPQTKQTGP